MRSLTLIWAAFSLIQNGLELHSLTINPGQLPTSESFGLGFIPYFTFYYIFKTIIYVAFAGLIWQIGKTIFHNDRDAIIAAGIYLGMVIYSLVIVPLVIFPRIMNSSGDAVTYSQIINIFAIFYDLLIIGFGFFLMLRVLRVHDPNLKARKYSRMSQVGAGITFILPPIFCIGYACLVYFLQFLATIFNYALANIVNSIFDNFYPVFIWGNLVIPNLISAVGHLLLIWGVSQWLFEDKEGEPAQEYNDSDAPTLSNDLPRSQANNI